MGKRCCIDRCSSNYDKSTATYDKSLKARNDLKNSSRTKVRVFGFSKSLEERRRWVKSIPYFTEERLDKYKTPPVVCIKHWPAEFPTVKNLANGKEQPGSYTSVYFWRDSSEWHTITTFSSSTAKADKTILIWIVKWLLSRPQCGYSWGNVEKKVK